MSHKLRLLAAIVLVQGLFWTLVVVLRPPFAEPLLESARIETIMMQETNGELVEARGRPDYYLGAGQQARFVADITVDQVDTGLVVFAPRYNRFISLEFNGEPVPSADAAAWRGGRAGAKWLIPPAMLRSGSNRITVDVERECCRAYLDSLVIGPPGEIDTAIRNWRLRAMLPAFAQLVIGLLGAAGCIVVMREKLHRSEAFAAGLAFAGMGIAGFWQIDLLTPSSEALYNSAGQMALLTLFAGLAALADRWFPGGPRYDRVIIVAAALLAVPILTGAFVTDGVPPFLRTLVEGGIVILANAVIIASAIRGLKADTQRWTFDAAVLSLAPTISLADLIDSIERDPLTLSSAPLGVLALALLLLYAIVRRTRTLSNRLENANAILELRIAEKQAELEATAALLRQREAEAAVQAERARIMRDMHDGTGGQLMSVLLMLRDDGTPKSTVAQTVEQAVDDLRLLIDSLDSVGDSIDFALGQFRERAEAKLRAAGMQLIWSNRIDGAATSLPPANILAIYRIMQEAINNAVRHSGGQTVGIRITSPPEGGIAIRITDDGKGGLIAWRQGRGLANMEGRARSIGGTLTVETGATGTTVELAIPAS